MQQTLSAVSLSLLVVCVSARMGSAQTESASISGTILDASGGNVPNASVEATSIETGVKRKAVTSSSGVYALTALGIGHFRVSVEAPGLQTYTWNNVELQVGQTRTLDAHLGVAAVVSDVEVSAAAAPVDESSAAVSGVVSGTQIRELPVNGRSWASLMTQTPGAIDSGGDNQRSIRFVGRGLDDNNFRFDGVDATGILNQEEKGTTFRLEFSTEAIAEFRTSAAVYTAESGGTQGGQVDLVSRSGANDWHGSVFEYLRNDAFDSRGPFDGASLPPFRLNQFGGSFGGPIRKNRDFFFVTYEGLRQRLGQTLIGYVPSAAFRAAALNASPGLAGILSAYPSGSFPTATAGVDQYVGTGRQLLNEDFGMFRYDHKFSDSNSLAVRYNIDNGLSDIPNGVLQDRLATTLATHNAVIELTTVLSPRTLNEFKQGFNRADFATQNESALNVQIAVPQFSTLYNNTGKLQASNSFDTLDTLSSVHGRHSLKAGVEIRRVQINSSATTANDYQFTYSSLGNFQKNILSQASLVDPLPVTGLRRTEYFGYAQDEFRIRPNLTANLGVRYEYFGVPSDVNGRGVVFDPLSCHGGYCPQGAAFYFPDYNNFSPRVSLTWSPGESNNKTVVRSGYGIYYGDGQVGDLTAPLDNLAARLVLSSSGLSYPILPSTYANDAFPLASPRSLDRHRRTPYTQEWSLSVQQALTSTTVLTVGYVGNKGTDQFTRSYLNTLNPVTHLRPLASFGIIDYKSTHSNSTFNGLQVSLQRNLANDLIAGANYMWSHSINDGATGGGEADYLQNVNCRACERASSDQDIRHYLSSNLIYKLPFGHGKKYMTSPGVLSAVLGNWEWSNIFSARSGLPVNITYAPLNASVIPDGNNVSPQRPNVAAGQSIVPANQNIGNFLNAGTFSIPLPGTFGNAGRNLGRGPDAFQLDTALVKHIPLTERLNLLFRAEAFNVFNRSQFGLPNGNVSSAVSFGKITTELNPSGVGTGTPRELQFALRLEF